MTAGQARWLSIVGLGEDGVAGLSPAAARAVAEAEVVFGGTRHLALARPLIRGAAMPWLSPLDASIPLVLARRGEPTCVLATGDPFHYGIGATLAGSMAPAEWACYPQASAFSLAAARLGWPLQDCRCLSLHGRALDRIIPDLQPAARILALSWDGSTPARLAELLERRGFGLSILTVCEAMGGTAERVRSSPASAFDVREIADLNTIGIDVKAEPDARIRPATAGMPDAWFEHDGQITKAPVRAVTVSALAPHPGALLWDVGAGSGSIAIEWLLSHPATRAVAIERQPERAARIGRNATAWGVADRLNVVEGSAPECFGDLPPPDAVFVGGGATSPGLLDRCRGELQARGRLVVNAVTIESQALLAAAFRTHGGDLLTVSVAQAEPVGGFHGMRPSMPVMQWRWSK